MLPLISTDGASSAHPENKYNIFSYNFRSKSVPHGLLTQQEFIWYSDTLPLIRVHNLSTAETSQLLWRLFLEEGKLNLFDSFFSLLILSVSLWITFHTTPPPPTIHFSFIKKRKLKGSWGEQSGEGGRGCRGQVIHVRTCTNMYVWHLITWKTSFTSQSKNVK